MVRVTDDHWGEHGKWTFVANQDGTRIRRANGEVSRQRILDAAVEVASERGYEGTSIGLVRARCGLPSSSIYWHFKNKDDLIAAVIERGFDSWLGAMTLPPPESGTSLQRAVAMSVEVAKALLETPEFLRLGLMLALERRPEEPSARTMFLQVRDVAHRKVAEVFAELAPGLDAASLEVIANYTIAASDGLFIAKEVGGDSIDLVQLFELHARAVFDIAMRYSADARSLSQPEKQ